MQTEAQKRANARYRKNNVRQIGLSFYPAEADLYEWAKSHDNVSGYLKALIRADMESARGAGAGGEQTS